MVTETTEKKTTARKPAATKQPKIYGALANILKALSVPKGGTLPSNMGGKSYITAVDLAAEAKRQFVENNIVFVPNEEVTKHEVLVDGGRKTVVVGIRGEYTLIHVEDGSSLTISGIGDGLATGTAVASNIASTNAQKNALLRAFMVTEQSVEDAAKNGEGDSPTEKQSPAARKVNAAKQPARPQQSTEGPDYREKIRAEIIENSEDSRTAEEVNELNKKLKSENSKSGLKELYEALKNGEVA